MKKKIMLIVCVLTMILSATSIAAETEWSDTLMSDLVSSEPDEIINLTDEIELGYYNSVRNDVTNDWRLVLTEDEFDIYDYMKDYHEAFKDDAEKGVLHCLIYCGEEKEDRTSTCIRLSDQSIDVTVHEYVSGEENDAKLMFTGEHIKERVLDVDTGSYYDYDTGESGTLDETASESDDPMVTYTDVDTVKKVQETLNAAGYDCGTPDGIAGDKTKAQIEKYQTDNGLEVTGTVTDELVESIGNLETETQEARQGEIVWISESGSRYHRKPSCSNMKTPKEIDKGEAERIGYTPCKRCY